MSDTIIQTLRPKLVAALELGRTDELRAILKQLADIDDPLAQALFHHYSATLLSFDGLYEDSIKRFDNALDLYRSVGDEDGMGSVFMNQAIDFARLGNTPAAVELTHHALAIYRTLDSEVSTGKALQNLGMLHRDSGSLSEALRYLRESESIFRSNNDTANLGIAMHSIGDLYGNLGDIDTAERYLLAAAAIAQENNHHSLVATCYLILVRHYINADRLSDAQRMVALSLEHAVPTSITPLLVAVYIWAARTEVLLGNADAATAHLNSVPRAVAIGHLNEGAFKIVEAEILTLQGDLDTAKSVCTEGIALLNERGQDQWLAYARSCMLEIARQQGDMDSYVFWHKEQERSRKRHSHTTDALRIATEEKERDIDAQLREHEKQLAILHSALPRHVADRLVRGLEVNDHFDNASVLFLDLVGFTALSNDRSPGEVVSILATIFRRFDEICQEHGVVKVKTIGDAYLAFASDADHAVRVARVALSMLDHLDQQGTITARIGLHCGPLIAGVVGTDRLQYDVWGDTVNVASRMESSALAGQIHVSGTMYEQLKDLFALSNCGIQDVKGKGAMETWSLERVQ